MDGVFFSYAEEDSSIARRIYDDLGRAGFNVWRYQEDGKKGVNILQEVRESIEKARYFCLVDSPHSRESDFVREECQLAREVASVKGYSKFIIICLVEEIGEWRKKELYEGQNLIGYIDLTDYENHIVELYEFLGKSFTSLLSVPRAEDFEGELKKFNIPERSKRVLVDLYTSFGSIYAGEKSDTEAAEHILNALKSQCKSYGVNMITPQIALAVLQADSERDEAALKTFSVIAQEFESDPRGWAGVGAAHFHLRDYQSALQAYERCHRLVMESDNEKHKSHLLEVVHNKAKVLLALGDSGRALREVEALPEQDRQHPAIQNLSGEILMSQCKWLQAIPCFEAAYNCYACSSFILNLAYCYKMTDNRWKEGEVLQLGIKTFPQDIEIMANLASYYLEVEEPFAAISYLQKAISNAPKAIQYRVELALILRRIGDAYSFHNEIKQCTTLEAQSATEHYYRGYAFYLLGNLERARNEYKMAKEDVLIKHWSYYEEFG